MTALLAAAPAVPLALALAWTVPRLRRHAVALAPWAAAPALVLALTPRLVDGQLPTVEGPLLGGLRLALDPTGQAFLLLTAALWLAVGAFARTYHARDRHRASFFGLFLLTMAGNLGLVVAGDILTFYAFFVLLTFSAWGLVVHERTREALRAGRIYIIMTVLADLAILAVLFALGSGAPGGAPGFGAELETAWAGLTAAGPGPGLTAALILLGFGVKAGLLPLHIWLPLAYREAPATASALLSGAMMKAGVLAWIRFLPESLAFPALAASLIAVGVVAAFFGVVVGLLQDDAKTVLAYSSVSQIGFIAVVIGVMIRDPSLAAVAVAAATVYALHHGLAKGALFLAVGVTDRTPARAGSRGPSRWPTVPLVGALLPALAIAGAPLTTGALAKGALGEATERLGAAWYHALHPTLLVAAFGTTLLLARFLVLLHRRGAPDRADPTSGAARTALLAPWILLVVGGGMGIFWIPWAVSSPGVALPGLLHAPLESLLPVVAGVVVAGAVVRRPGLLGPLGRLRVPVGDLVVPLEDVARRVRRVLGALVTDPRPDTPRRAWDVLTAGAGRTTQWLADHDIRLMRGVIVGSIIAVLAALLVLAGLP
ncbi:MAG: complex I subunit 5 family protein [Longimicrobiales bacterium]